jgi:hypothetical protein
MITRSNKNHGVRLKVGHPMTSSSVTSTYDGPGNTRLSSTTLVSGFSNG